mgnify:CR=1 FL=1
MTQQALIDAVNDLADQLQEDRTTRQQQDQRDRRERRSNNNALVQLTKSVVSFYNPINRLKDAVQENDRTLVKALASNVDFQKVLQKNSQFLSETTARLSEVREALVDAYSKGVRESTLSVNKLTERMVKTGQDTKALNTLNAEIIKLTGGSIDAIDSNAKNIEKYAKLGQISNERVIDAVKALSDKTEDLSIFGPQAVEGFNKAVASIQARTGVDTTKELGQIASLLMPTADNLTKLTRLGFNAEFMQNQVAKGENVENILLDVAEAVTTQGKVDANNAAISLMQAQGLTDLNVKQLAAASVLTKNSNNSLRLDKTASAKEGAEDKSIKAIRDSSLKYYDEIAPAIQGGIAAMGSDIATLLQVVATGAGIANIMPAGFIPGRGGKGGKGGKMSKGVKAGGVAALATIGLDMGEGMLGVEEGGTFDKVTDVLSNIAAYAGMGTAAGSVVPGLGNVGGGIAGGIYGGYTGIRDAFFSDDPQADAAEKTRQRILREQERQTKLAQEEARREEDRDRATSVQNNARYLAAAIREAAPEQALDSKKVEMLLSVIAGNTVSPYTSKGMLPEDQ